MGKKSTGLVGRRNQAVVKDAQGPKPGFFLCEGIYHRHGLIFNEEEPLWIERNFYRSLFSTDLVVVL
jgi:hypothetical protein